MFSDRTDTAVPAVSQRHRPEHRGILLVLLFFFLATLLALPGCTVVPETGRRQLNFIGTDAELEMGLEAYKQALEKAPVSTDKAANDLLRRVGGRIREATDDAGNFKWEFTLIQDDNTMNAWCLPGGKVAVYTGILKVTQDEAGLATVLGHEIAHATLHHGAERMSQTTLADFFLKESETAVTVAFQNKDPQTVQAVMGALGLGAQVGVLLPWSRKHESEADQVGLLYMARAGYDPEKAIEFWKRMKAMSDSSKSPPAWLSTHPSDDQRIADLYLNLAKAKAQYKPR